MLKIGSSEAGQAAALSHTGGLAGSDRVFNAVFARAGAVRVQSLEALVQAGAAVAATRGRRLAVRPSVVPVAASGGFGIMMADAAQGAGLAMNPVSADAAQRIKAVLPLASTANPVDATAQMSANPEVLEVMLDALLEDDANDIVCMMLALGMEVPRLRSIYLDTFRAVTARHPDRLLMACVSQPPDAIRELATMGVACFPTIDALYQGIAVLARASNPGEPQPDIAVPAADTPLPAEAFGNEAGAKRALALAGLPMPDERIATSAHQAAEIAKAFGKPVAMKILSADVQHKSDVGGVMLGVDGEQAADAAFERIISSVSAEEPQAVLDGVLVTPMVSGGVELILGISSDPLFGPMVMVGLGGIYAEVFRDTALRPAPVSEKQALQMLRELKSFPLLDGVRGRPKADVAAAARAIAALSEFAVRHAAQVAEADVNPLLVLPQGAVVLDALLVSHSQDKTKELS